MSDEWHQSFVDGRFSDVADRLALSSIHLKLSIAFSLLIPNIGFAGEPKPIDLTGKWTGTWESTRSPGYYGSMTLDIVQKGNNVTGTSTTLGSKCDGKRDFTGVLEDARLTGKFTSKAGDVALQAGTVSASSCQVSFIYNFTEGACKGDGGTWVMVKEQKEPCAPR